MATVRIEQLTLRVRRKGGWSWGPDPAAWVRAAERALPQLLGAELGALLDRRVVERVRGRWKVRVKLSAREMAGLLSATASSPARAAPSSPRLRAAIRAELSRSLLELGAGRLVLRRAGSGRDRRGTDADAANAEPHLSEPGTSESDLAQVSIANLLRRWRRHGVLLSTLQSAAPDSIRRWHDVLLGGSSSSGGAAPPDDARLARAAAAIVAGLTAPGSMTPWGRRMLVAMILADQEGVRPHDPSLLVALDRVVPLDDGVSPEAGPADLTSPPSAQASPPAPASQSRARATLDLLVPSVLPFLAIGVLDRLGWLAAALAHIPSAQHAEWATAFAFKLAGVPQRGWRRSPDDERLAAAFTGRTERLPEPRLCELALALDGELGEVDTFGRKLLERGRSPGDACIVVPAEHAGHAGLLACEMLGTFPIAWAVDAAALAAALAGFGAGPIAVPGPDVSPSTLAALEEAGLAFVTDVPPTRREPWRVVPGLNPRVWSNAAHPDRPAIGAALARLRREDSRARAAAAWRALDARPSVVRASSFDLDRSLTLAAGLALGTLAWILWREREPTDPALAFERFGDLDGRVVQDGPDLLVRIPRGRRRDDLNAHGLLGSVSGLPWLKGRLSFGVA